MTEILTSRKASFQTEATSKRSTKKKATTQLTFHLSDEMKEKLSMNSDVINEDVAELKLLEIRKIAEALKNIEAINAVENMAVVEFVEAPATPVLAPEVQVDEVYPYLSLAITNQQAVYQVGTSFLHDIENEKRNFGFASLSSQSINRHLMVYGGFINYSTKKPVLVIVKDINCKSLDAYRSNFTAGTLWKWQTNDWGNLCFVDYKELNKYTEELSQVDLKFITTEFVAVVWALSPLNIQDDLNKATLPILGKLDSVTFVIEKGKTKSKNIKKAASYYQCFSIPVKGVLVEDGE
jgi:hypothetical protein